MLGPKGEERKSGQVLNKKTHKKDALLRECVVKRLSTHIIWYSYMYLQHIYIHIHTGWWFQQFFIFHNIWDNSSHCLIFFKMVQTTNQICTYIYICNHPLIQLGIFHNYGIRKHMLAATWPTYDASDAAAPDMLDIQVQLSSVWETNIAIEHGHL